MPRVGKQKNTKKTPNVSSITCQSCGDIKKPTDFYVSSSVYHAGTGRVQFCKDCCFKMSHDNNIINIEKLKKLLEQIDKPFLKDVLQSAYEESNKDGGKTPPFQLYFKNLNSLGQYKKLTWKDSVFNCEERQIETKLENYDTSIKLTDFNLTDKIIEKWGFGYSPEEYQFFEKKWNQLIDNYGEKTSFHIEGLKTYIRFRVKEELATASGNVKDAKEWANLARDAATAAKINVSQLSKSDISGGVDLLPQLFEAVESEVGIIPILPHLKEQPYDDADLIIWSVVNYIRRLEDKPRIEYKDIWDFYDEMLSEHFKQQGYKDEEVKLEKNKRNNVFRDLGLTYKEPIYEESES